MNMLCSAKISQFHYTLAATKVVIMALRTPNKNNYFQVTTVCNQPKMEPLGRFI